MALRRYEPPQARDLSEYSVNGQWLRGSCITGNAPWIDCVLGNNFPGGGCVPTGLVPEAPRCEAGSVALVACENGSQA